MLANLNRLFGANVPIPKFITKKTTSNAKKYHAAFRAMLLNKENCNAFITNLRKLLPSTPTRVYVEENFNVLPLNARIETRPNTNTIVRRPQETVGSSIVRRFHRYNPRSVLITREPRWQSIYNDRDRDPPPRSVIAPQPPPAPDWDDPLAMDIDEWVCAQLPTESDQDDPILTDIEEWVHSLSLS